MADHIRWGILGASNFAQKTMGPAINEARRSRLVALATRSPDKARPFADLAPGLRLHDSYDALLADPEIDAVYIPLPNALHVEWSLKAAAAGKAVLCEKPIGMQEADFDRLIDAREQSGCLIAEAYMPVHHPQWSRIRSLIAQGVIGDLHTVTGCFSYGLHAKGNVRNKADLGGGGLRDVGVYPIGTFRYATGLEPQVTSADFIWEDGVDASAWITTRAGETRFSFHTSMRTTRKQEMTFEGTKGSLRATAPFNPGTDFHGSVILRIEGEGDLEETHTHYPGTRQYALQVENFCATLLDGTAYPCPLEFSRGTQAVIDAAFAMGNPPT